MDSTIINLLTTYQLPAIFLGAFFFGETVILSAAFLAGQGVWSVESVFWLSFVGTIFSDSLWFFLGLAFFKWTHRWEKLQGKYDSFLAKLEKMTGQKPFLALLFIKFLYGTRILTIIYLSIRKIHFGTFLFFNTIGTVLWLLVMVSVGWSIGMGVANLGEIFRRIEYVLTALVLLIIVYKIFTTWLSKEVIEK